MQSNLPKRRRRDGIEYVYSVSPKTSEDDPTPPPNDIVFSGDTWSVKKHKADFSLRDFYTVTIPEDIPLTDLASEHVRCSCMGFRQQKYPKIMHKHVQLVIAHRAEAEADATTNWRTWWKLDTENIPHRIPTPAAVLNGTREAV